MKRTGFILILLSILLCIGSISLIPARSYTFDAGDIIRMIFIIGIYLLLAIIGALLLIMDKLNNYK